MKQYAIGTDIGGSHISNILIDLKNEKLVDKSTHQLKVDNSASSEEILNSWETSISQALKNIPVEQLAGIGFAMPGPFDYVNGIGKFTPEVAKYEKLYGVDITKTLKKLMDLPADVKLRYINDATSFAIGESWMGAAVNYRKVIAITLGTGFGSAFLDAGVPVLEGSEVPKQGCVWHLPYENGIADDYFSTRWYIKRYADLTGKSLPGVKEISEEAARDDKVKFIFEEFGEKLGKFLVPIIKNFNAQCLVIGGNVTGAFGLWGPAFKSAIEEKHNSIAIHLSTLGEIAAMIGSARLFDEIFWEKVKPLLSKM